MFIIINMVSYVEDVAVLTDGTAKIFSGEVHTKCFLCPVGDVHFNMKNASELKKMRDTLS